MTKSSYTMTLQSLELKANHRSERSEEPPEQSLPPKLAPGVDYTVPEDIKTDPGDFFAYVWATCYGNDVSKIKQHFDDISRQSFWIWRRHGKGVPRNYLPHLEKLVKDETEPFRLPTNAVIEDLLRPVSGKPTASKREDAKPNQDLLGLLSRITKDDTLGNAALPAIQKLMARPVKNPYRFYLWAWLVGGVPASYLDSFLTALMQLGIYRLYGFGEGNKVAWFAWAEKALAIPPGTPKVKEEAAAEAIDAEDDPEEDAEASDETAVGEEATHETSAGSTGKAEAPRDDA